MSDRAARTTTEIETEAHPPVVSLRGAGRGKSQGRRLGWIRLPEIPLAFSERKLLLFLGDTVLLNLALLLGMDLAPRSGVQLTLATVVANPQWFITLTMLWWYVAAVLDTYNLETSASKLAGPLAALKALFFVAVIYFFIPYWSAPLTSTRLAWALFFIFGAAGVMTWRFLYVIVFVQPQFQRRVLIVGAGWSGETILATIRDGYGQDYDVVGFIDDDPAKAGTVVRDVPVIGTRHDLVRLVQERGIRKVVLAITHNQQIHGDLFQAVMDCYELGVEVMPMPHLYERLTGRVPVEHIGQQINVLLPLNYNVTTPLYIIARRVVDVAGALVGLIGLALALPFITLAIRLDSPGPVYYRQTRVGKGGRRFQVIKLRTMVQGAENPGEPVWAQENDARVTRFGHLARKSRLDELPQLWNVLKGEMRLVGPRPERPELIQELQKQIPFYRSRHAVKPGLTGWAQINYEYGNSVADSLAKLQYDLYYIKYRSLYLDLLILARTIGTVLSFGGT